MEEIKELKERIRLLEEENARLRECCDTDCCGEPNSSKSSADDGCCKARVDGESKSTSFEGILEPEQIERYSRQLLLSQGFGVEGQKKLLKSNVLVIGAGGIGSTGKPLSTQLNLFAIF